MSKDYRDWQNHTLREEAQQLREERDLWKARAAGVVIMSLIYTTILLALLLLK